MEDYNVKYFYISKEEKKDDDGNIFKAPNVTIIGNSEYIDNLYKNEIKGYNNYNNNYGNNYNYSSSYRQSNKRYNNNYYNYNQDNYKYNKGYNNNHNNYY